ncbi:hypothetical protein Spith_0392 [Spirochaeta thermophila DSM 6578]|uniref:MFS transporter n=1 Tax=Winmispira thermophila (strain ATCC 700085 / DSM 6578 / Z-1203) TaxID=869211 RepID=G0GEI9_WINT7|nr:MFS transporter [Spirochaeta thermophila]AEJ60677.1 hypothetical protein Spith_0392 [Spirochaeta thermophila DSM 6578]
MRTSYLSPEERHEGLRAFLAFNAFNGVGFGLLAETIVYLLALQYGATNLQLGYISSLIHLTGFLLILFPHVLKGAPLVPVYFGAWLGRGLVALLYWLTLLVSPSAAIWVILATYTLFCMLRTVGVALYRPVQKMLSTPSTLGSVMVQANLAYSLTMIIGQLLSFLFLSSPLASGPRGLLSLILGGVLFNSVASLFLLRIPSRERIASSGDEHIVGVLLEALRNPRIRYPVLLHWIHLGTTILLGFSTALLKRGLGLPENLVVLYTMTTYVGLVAAGFVNRPFVDRLPARPLLLLSFGLEIPLFLVFAFLRPGAAFGMLLILGFALGFVKGTIAAHVGRTLVHAYPDDRKFSYNAMVNFVTSFLALGFGMAGGALADLGVGVAASLPFLNEYSLVFAAGTVLVSVSMVISLGVRDARRMEVRELLGVFLSPEHLTAMLGSYRLESTRDERKRRLILNSLMECSSPLAEREIERILRHPFSVESKFVLNRLFVNPKLALLPRVLTLAGEPGYVHRERAIFALGAYRGPEVERVLRTALDDPDPAVRGAAAKSLVRAGYPVDPADLFRRFLHAPVVREEVDYLIALGLAEEEEFLFRRIFTFAEKREGPYYRMTVYSAISSALGTAPLLGDLFMEEESGRGKGVSRFLEEAVRFVPFWRERDRIGRSMREEKWEDILLWVEQCIRGISANEGVRGVLRAFGSALREKLSGAPVREDAIAALYFFYALLDRNPEQR